MKISDISIKKPISVIVLMVTVCVVGFISFLHLPVNLLPDITYPMIKVYVYWRGATPEEIEDNIADIIEPKMATVDNLDYLESECTEGLYTLLVNFSYDADRDIAYQDVLAKMGLVRKKLPKDADEPLIFKADPSQLPVMDLIITSDEWDIVKLRTWVENYLSLQFASVPGSAGTEVSGGAVREIRVYLNPHKIQMLGLSIEKIAQRLKEENIELAGGRVTTERKEFIVRTKAYYKDLNEIKNLIISNDKYGKNIYLRDIAEIKDTSDIQRVVTRLNKKEGVKLSIFKQASANTLDVEKGVQQKLKELKTILPAGVNIGVIYNQATYIRSANKGVRDAAVIAGILVVLVTALFLSGWKRVLIMVITLPVSLLGTFFFMKLFNFSINIFSLGGLVVSFTVILDNSIVVLENITRLQKEKKSQNIIAEAVNQVSQPIFFSTLTFIAIFLPFLMIPGLTSLLFKELVITVSVVIGFSLIAALTIIPALSNLLFSETDYNMRQNLASKFNLVVDKYLKQLETGYSRIITDLVKKHKKMVVVIFVFLLAVSVFMFRFLGTEFLPKADDGMITVKVKMPTGTAMKETDKVLKQIENIVKDLPGIESYSTISGGKVWGLVTYEIPNEGEVNIQLVPKNKRRISTDGFVAKYAKEIQKNAKYPGAKVMVFHTKMKGIRQTGAFDIEIELHSPKTTSLVEMYETATKIVSRIKDMGDISNLDISMDIAKPEYQFLVNRSKTADLGLSATQVAGTIRTLIDGQITTYYKEGGYFYPIRLVVDEKYFKGKEDVSNIPLFTKSGLIYLRDVGQLTHTVNPVSVNRLDQMRVIKVTASVLSGNVGKVTSEVYKQVKDIPLPAGSFLRTGGQAQMMRENFKNMVFVILLGIFFAFVLLAVQFESLLLPAVIILTMFFPLTGFVFILLVTHIPLGVTALIGILVLIGMLINHWVLVLSFIEEQIKNGENANIEEAIVKGASLRMSPIIMTYLTDVLALFPFVLALGEGTEMLRPLGVAVVGGITFSLIVTFIFLPTFYHLVKSYFIKIR